MQSTRMITIIIRISSTHIYHLYIKTQGLKERRQSRSLNTFYSIRGMRGLNVSI